MTVDLDVISECADNFHKSIKYNIKKFPLTTIISSIALFLIFGITKSPLFAIAFGISIATIFGYRKEINYSIGMYERYKTNEWQATNQQRESVAMATTVISVASSFFNGVKSIFSGLFHE